MSTPSTLSTRSAPKALLTLGPDTHLVAGLIPGLGERRMVHSFGEVIPNLTGFDVAYWCAGIWAARLQHIGLAMDLCSPGAAWLAGVDVGLTGRTINVGTVKDLLAQVGPDERVWVKPAEAKMPSFPAGVYTPAAVAGLLAAAQVAEDLELQWTTTVLGLDFEHRFFVVDGRVVTGSPYRVGAQLGFGPNISWGRFEEAQEFAEFAVRCLAGDDMLPPHFTLDVGFDVVRGRWLVVEGNRSWSSGVYGCEPVAALASIEAATHYSGDRWRWRPDAAIKERAATMQKLTVLSLDAMTGGFVEYQRG